MATPSFGPSQRIEISRGYLHLNETCDRRNGYRIYDAINPRDNVAEEGQVVLLDNEQSEFTRGLYGHTFVVPDAAGYVVDVDMTNMTEKQKHLFLQSEIARYNVGVNQVEKGVKSAHTSTGNGWDISFTPGHPVVICNTGHEPISRFDLIGVRFPNEDDMRAQAEAWSGRRASENRGNCVSKFATYPIQENEDMMKHDKFVEELHALRDNVIQGYHGADAENARLELMQVPALFKLVCQVYRCLEKEKDSQTYHDRLRELLAFVDGASSDSTAIHDILMAEELVDEITKVAKAACDFTSTLRPPFILAQCIDFKGAQPHQKRVANCGDAMKCILL